MPHDDSREPQVLVIGEALVDIVEDIAGTPLARAGVHGLRRTAAAIAGKG